MSERNKYKVYVAKGDSHKFEKVASVASWDGAVFVAQEWLAANPGVEVRRMIVRRGGEQFLFTVQATSPRRWPSADRAQ